MMSKGYWDVRHSVDTQEGMLREVEAQYPTTINKREESK